MQPRLPLPPLPPRTTVGFACTFVRGLSIQYANNILLSTSVGSCQNCSTIHGSCVKGFCVCELGWEGQSCELKGQCIHTCKTSCLKLQHALFARLKQANNGYHFSHTVQSVLLH